MAPRLERAKSYREKVEKKKETKSKKIKKKQQQHFTFKCPICFNGLQNQPVLSTRCGHVFCKGCLQSALAIKPYCPTCRKKIGKYCYHALYLDGIIQPADY